MTSRLSFVDFEFVPADYDPETDPGVVLPWDRSANPTRWPTPVARLMIEDDRRMNSRGPDLVREISEAQNRYQDVYDRLNPDWKERAARASQALGYTYTDKGIVMLGPTPATRSPSQSMKTRMDELKKTLDGV